jgi:aryl-alcohol dehydrogenase-like predicted oxidoreductase
MIYHALGQTGMRISVLGFGCASAMSRYGTRATLRSMEAAFEAGINYFDAARSYGFGEAEHVLGCFAKGRRDRIVLATKFGIAATARPPWFHRMLKPACPVGISHGAPAPTQGDAEHSVAVPERQNLYGKLVARWHNGFRAHENPRFSACPRQERRGEP